jgi:predicted unusual protein kinase regulating ubiquinone biosynthesis (AarF/ABC1/UbiB family)
MLRRRYRRILYFFARVISSLIIWDILLPKIGLKKLTEKRRKVRFGRIAARYRNLAVQMGGVTIKVGQFLSARVDMLPAEVTDELSGLQDQVPAEDFQQIRRLAETELGGSLEDIFDSFEEEPLASASLGQVHRAVLKPEDALDIAGSDPLTEVVIKIQRPDIEQIIEVDLSAFRIVMGWMQRYKPIRKRVDLPALMDEFSSVLGQEIDYINEGQNAERFWEIYTSDPGIKVPRVIWSKTTRRVLVLEDVYAIKITNYQEIKRAGVDLNEVALRLFRSYMDQIFEKDFFHADPHPGNLFVIPPADSPDGTWKLAFVDFGMVGYVPESARDGLREAMIAIGTQDAKRLVDAYDKLGFLLPGADLELIAKAEQQAFDHFWGKSLSELQDIDHKELMAFADEFRDLMYEMPFQVPQDLLLLGRTMAILAGMCTGLDPGFNMLENIRPYAEELVKSELSGNWEKWWTEIEMILRSLISLPGRFDAMLAQVERGELLVQAPALEVHLERIEKNLQGLTMAVLFAALFVGGMQLVLAGFSLPGFILLGSALIPLLVILLR